MEWLTALAGGIILIAFMYMIRRELKVSTPLFLVGAGILTIATLVYRPIGLGSLGYGACASLVFAAAFVQERALRSRGH